MAHAGRPHGLIPDGPKIKRLRIELGLTVAQVAEQVGFHPQSIRRTELGRPVSDVYASRIARALGVKLSDITNWDDGDDSESEPEPKALAS